jgi:hypothetical protein
MANERRKVSNSDLSVDRDAYQGHVPNVALLFPSWLNHNSKKWHI